VTATAPLASSGGTNPNLSLTGIVPVANGGTGAATAAQALANLGGIGLASANAFTNTNTFQSSTAGIDLIVQAAVGQTNDLQQWKDATGNIVAHVSPTGVISGDGSGLRNINGANIQFGSVTYNQIAAGTLTYNNVNLLTGGIVASNAVVYTTTKSLSQIGGQVTVIANCTGVNDILLSGGCDVNTPNAWLNHAGPVTGAPSGWQCTGYYNTLIDYTVTATALCYPHP
jgi:hypothetical protein